MADFAEREGARMRYVPSLGKSINPFADARALMTLIATARKFRPQIVHTHTAKAGFLGRLAAMLVRPAQPSSTPTTGMSSRGTSVPAGPVCTGCSSDCSRGGAIA